jgi:hypothetical protein
MYRDGEKGRRRGGGKERRRLLTRTVVPLTEQIDKAVAATMDDKKQYDSPATPLRSTQSLNTSDTRSKSSARTIEVMYTRVHHSRSDDLHSVASIANLR